MKQITTLCILLVFLGNSCNLNTNKNLAINLNNKSMKITSDAFQNNEKIPAIYTCDGNNTSPDLNIEGAPANTKSLALIVDDPDAPAGLWTHWTVWNINPNTTKINANSKPEGSVVGPNTRGNKSYGGPCPPSGTHRYFFKIYALDTVLDIREDSVVATLKKALEGHILDSATIIGLYR